MQRGQGKKNVIPPLSTDRGLEHRSRTVGGGGGGVRSRETDRGREGTPDRRAMAPTGTRP